MKLLRRQSVAVALLLGLSLAAITFGLRGSFWSANDYGLLSLSHAIHLEWRLSHLQNFPAPGLSGHPGIPFYFASWIAVALVVPSFSAGGLDRYSEIIANAEAIYVANQAIAISLIALGSFLFVRVAARVAPFGVILAALGMWLGSSYQAILTSTFLSIETFALPLNVLFLWILLRIAASPRISVTDSVLAGLVAAFGYLMKLPYLYVAFGLASALLSSFIIHRVRLIPALSRSLLSLGSFVLCIGMVGYVVIGAEGLEALLRFHESVLFHSGHYGTGEIGFLKASHAKAAFNSSLTYGSFAPWAALLLGLVSIVFAVKGARSGSAKSSEVILGVGAGVSAILAAMGVLKHFQEHYAAGVAPTLLAVVIALFLLVQKPHPHLSKGFRLLVATLLTFGILNSLYFSVGEKLINVARRSELSLDRQKLEFLLDATQGRTLFTYHLPMPEFGEGFILHYTGIPLLQQKYLASDRNRLSSFMLPKGLFRYVVLDKDYFASMSAVRAAKTLNPASSVQVSLSSADRIVELRCCFVVIKEKPFLLSEP